MATAHDESAPLPPIDPENVRLYRGEGVHRWTRGEWGDAPSANGEPSHGRWFTSDLERAHGYARGIGGVRQGYVKYVDVPRDVARASFVDDKARSTFVLPRAYAERAVEIEPGSARAAQDEYERVRMAMAETDAIRARLAESARVLRTPAGERSASAVAHPPRGESTASRPTRRPEPRALQSRAPATLLEPPAPAVAQPDVGEGERIVETWAAPAPPPLSPSRRRGRRGPLWVIVAGGGLLAGMCVLLAVVTMMGVVNSPTNSWEPSQQAMADIPTEYLKLYLQAGESRGIDWAILAAIGSIETDHGRSTASGVHSGVNAYGCCAARCSS
jgi:hypothetical protein